MTNRNTLWATTLVDELARQGLRSVCIAPGSRHTPLVMAFARQAAIQTYRHRDERSAAFFALGLALASDEPVAVVCTSGTAGANFFPAIIEAAQSRVPLIVLTADRPPELRHSGANQTIDQVKLYGDQVLWSVDAALPEAEPPAVALRNLRTLAARTWGVANGLHKGVVHVNLPFRKPLEPTPVEGDTIAPPEDAAPRPDGTPFTRMIVGRLLPEDSQLAAIADRIGAVERGLIVCGPRCPGGDFSGAVAALAERLGFPLLADPLSGMRFGAPQAIGGYDTFLMQPPVDPPEMVIRFGGVPTSKWLNQYLDSDRIQQVIYVSGSGQWADDSHRVSLFLQADETAFCQALTDLIQPRDASAWGMRLTAVERAIWEAFEQALLDGDYFDGAVLADVLDLIPSESTLFVGNSLPVRHLDQFGRPTSKRLDVYANRGASGIDGNISTGLGAGAARPDRPLVLVVGDTTFYHDMNGLLAVRECGIPATVVLLNNNGGGIFHRLPIQAFEPEFTDYFVMPHDLHFEPAARLYGLDYLRVETRQDFRRTFAERVSSDTASIIEVPTRISTDAARRQAVIAAVQAKLSVTVG
jgi:2-succinyl-5-enolpyruvyl-6-hydroxy-3-cyclohexene-1-carboxylate synthase